MRYKIVVERDRVKQPDSPFNVRVYRGLPIPGGGGVLSWEPVNKSNVWLYTEKDALTYGEGVAKTDAHTGRIMSEDRSYRRVMEFDL